MNEDEILKIFPTVIQTSVLNDDFTETEKNCFEQYKKESDLGILNNFTYDTFVLKNPKLSRIKNFIEEKINMYFRNVISPTSNNNQIYITESWISITKLGQSHHEHFHANSLLSGVMYLETIQENSIIFSNPNNQLFYFQQNPNQYNYGEAIFKTKKGTLLIFPSHIKHRVPMNKFDKDRVSLSFNTFVKGEINNESNLTKLTI